MNQPPKVVLSLVKKYKADTEGYIKVKVWLHGRATHIPKTTGYKVAVSQWDAEEEIVKRSHSDAADINREIHKEKGRIAETLKLAFKQGVDITPAFVATILNENKNITGRFIQFYDEYLDYVQTKFTKAYYDHFRIEYNYLVKFAGEDLSFSDITAVFLERYEMSLTCAATTKYGKLKKLKEVINRAIDHDKMNRKQIVAYTWPDYTPPDRPYLTLSQTELIGNAIYNGEFDHDEQMRTIACFFLVECWAGVRFSDWSRFEVETLIEDRNLKVIAKKNKQPIYLPLNVFTRLGRIVDYISEHHIKFDQSEGNTNRVLKLIAKHVKLPAKFHTELTTHIGRHTCGTLLGEMGYTTSEISEVLGISEQTAKTYVKRTRQGLQSAFAKHGGL